MKLKKLRKVSLRQLGSVDEKWVQERIAEDPEMLGLGKVVLRDKERPQPAAGRLDLLLQDTDTSRRYEVELQLGKVDESHIIRTLEYWDIERKRYPQYDHCAVIIAEEITSRFLNVIGLFNGHIPLIAIKLDAYQQNDDELSLAFTTVLDEMSLGLVDDEEEVALVTDRAYWLKQASPETVRLADAVLEQIKTTINDNLDLKYNKFYIGISRDGRAYNFCSFVPRKRYMQLEIKLPFTEDTQAQLEERGIDNGYDQQWKQYKLRLTDKDLKANNDFVMELLQQAYAGFRQF